MSPSLYINFMAFPYPIVGPVPAYTNVPIHSDYYEPQKFFIQTITLGVTTTVTTTVAHDYVVGQQVRLLIPQRNGCFQLNNLTGYVISLPSSTQVEIDLNSALNVNAFASASGGTQPQIVAIGDINSGYINSSGRIRSTTDGNTNINIAGSFINISPQ